MNHRCETDEDRAKEAAARLRGERYCRQCFSADIETRFDYIEQHFMDGPSAYEKISAGLMCKRCGSMDVTR